ncbi:MAG: hypothetical protein M1839_002767 [Geoglossum umbratile]|nr:MAG: hypothetical protein M1839_002767 [Geoglossum umbratile]
MPENPPLDPYKTLGVPRDAKLPEIRSAHRKLILKCHPHRFTDKTLKAAGEREFHKVHSAYAVLSDEESRRRCDELAKRLELSEAPRRRSRREFATRDSPGMTSAEDDCSDSPPETPYAEDDDSDSFVSRLRIEREIKSRNEKAYRNLQQAAVAQKHPARGQDPTSTAADPVSDESGDAKKPATKVILSSVSPSQLGIKVLNPETTDTFVDIIAVHGLGAIPEITWRERNSGVNWLADPAMLPKAVPDARIMRFGYDSLWLGKEPIRTKLSTIANKLLLVLSREREDAQGKPLIFIGHCFGGLVIERALIIAKLLERSFPGILNSTVGVVFLGTPHRGSKAFLPQSDLLAAIASQSDLQSGIEPGVLGAMRSDSGATLDVAEDFADLCRSAELLVTCFFEQRKSSLGKVIGRSDIQQFIVPEESATFDGHPRYGLPLDHFSLNKFTDPDNGNFKDVCGEITRMYRVAKQRHLSRGPNPHGARKASSKPTRRDPPPPLKPSSNGKEEEEDLREVAIQELNREEADKLAAAKEEEFEKRYRERLAAELRAKEKEETRAEAEAEQRYKGRLAANMKKYGVRDPQEIIGRDPLPSRSGLTPQEIKDMGRWYKNRVKVALLNRGLPDGQVDEILNDTGDTMLIDGVRTTYTKMALKWISVRTLKRYDLPYKIDEDDPSTVIVKRWVPEYEQEFLWDHTYKLRKREKRRREDSPEQRPAPKHTLRKHIPLDRGYESEHISRRRRNSGNLSEKPGRTGEKPIRPAPTTEDIARRRRNSRTLGNERPVERTHRQPSYESVHSLRETRKEGGWASDGETAPRGVFSRSKKRFAD